MQMQYVWVMPVLCCVRCWHIGRPRWPGAYPAACTTSSGEHSLHTCTVYTPSRVNNTRLLRGSWRCFEQFWSIEGCRARCARYEATPPSSSTSRSCPTWSRCYWRRESRRSSPPESSSVTTRWPSAGYVRRVTGSGVLGLLGLLVVVYWGYWGYW